jgi:nucleoside-diphosphate-sugar epimerase
MTESTPLANPHWDYSRNKIACEQRLLREYRENRFPITIVRPSLTYGDTIIPLAIGSWNRPWTIVERMRQGKPIIVHGDGASLWTTTHNTDFAKGFVGLFGQPKALGEAFHITSDEVLTWDQHYQIVGQVSGVEPDLVHIPSEVLVAYDRSMEGNLLGDKTWSMVLDNSKIKRFVPQFAATTTFHQGMQRTIGYLQADPKRQLIDDKFNQWCDRVLAGWQRAMPA